MAYPLRWYIPGVVYELTSRTMQERFLLRPGPESRALVEGVLGRGLQMFPAVHLHGYHVMSNHVELLASTDCGAQLAAFLGYFFGNVALELGRLHNWSGHFWARRVRPIPIVDDDAVVARLRYLLAQGVKEGLVDRPESWPGASSTRGLLGERIVGTWVDRDGETRARKRGERDLQRFRTPYEVRLEPLPGWAHLSPRAQRGRVQALIDSVVREARAARRGPPLGVERLLAQDPHGRPDDPASSPAPTCHASSSATRNAFRAAYRRFLEAFRTVARAVGLAATAARADYPPGSFPRPHWHVPAPKGEWPLWLPGVVPRLPSGRPDT